MYRAAFWGQEQRTRKENLYGLLKLTGTSEVNRKGWDLKKIAIQDDVETSNRSHRQIRRFLVVAANHPEAILLAGFHGGFDLFQG